MLAPLADQPIPFRRRPDLIDCRVASSGGPRWRIKDPVTARYYELGAHEHAILSLLDGVSSARQIARQFADRFPPLQLDLETLRGYLARLTQAGLVIGLAPPDSRPAAPARLTQAVPRIARRLLSLVSIRLPGVNPQRLLQRLYPAVRWLFHPAVMTGVIVTATILLLIVAGELATGGHAFPTWNSLLAPAQIVWLWAAIALARMVHELAHALTCQHSGGRCQELGVLLLCGAPCLYCDVSDAWLLPRRWSRIAISAAGVVAELVIASLAGLVWWQSQPGPLQSLALALMVACSANTLLINGNPLLRYDGYYILIDLLQEPHLADDARTVWREWWQRALLGIAVPHPVQGQSLPRWGLAVYGAAAALYRLAITIAILAGLQAALAAIGLPDVGFLLMTAVAAAWLLLLLGSTVEAGRDLGWRRRVRRGPVLRALLLTLLLAGFIAALPVPQSISARAILEAPDAPRVYVTTAGRMERSFAGRGRVERGEVLARLTNPELEREVLRLSSDHRQAVLQLRRLEVARAADPQGAAQIPTAREVARSLEQRLEQRRADLERLVIRAPVSGEFLPPPLRCESPLTRLDLKGWQGTPLSAINHGCWLDSGTLLGQIAGDAPLQPLLLVSQSDIDLVRAGQPVRLVFAERPGQVLRGTIVDVGGEPYFEGGGTPSDSGVTAITRSAARVPRTGVEFACRVQLDTPLAKLLLRDTGSARVTIESTPWGARGWRWLRQSFRIP